jgi:hypothetical protein
MSETGGGMRRNREAQSQRQSGPPPGASASAGWTIFSYMIGGMALYGAIGWLISRWTQIALLFPAGMLAGLGLAITMIILRYRRP